MWWLVLIAFVAGYLTCSAVVLIEERMGLRANFQPPQQEQPLDRGWQVANALCDALHQAEALRFIAAPLKSEPVAKTPVIALPDHRPMWIQ